MGYVQSSIHRPGGIELPLDDSQGDSSEFSIRINGQVDQEMCASEDEILLSRNEPISSTPKPAVPLSHRRVQRLKI